MQHFKSLSMVSFAINLVWLLDAFNSHSAVSHRLGSSLILNRPSSVPSFVNSTNPLYLTNSSENYPTTSVTNHTNDLVNNGSNNNTNINNKSSKLKTTSSAVTSLQELDHSVVDGDADKDNDNNECKTEQTPVPTPVPNALLATTTTTTPTTITAVNDQSVYSIQALREILLPMDNTIRTSLILSSISHENYNTEVYNDVSTDENHSVNNISPPTTNSEVSPKIQHAGHKRTTSDVTSLRTNLHRHYNHHQSRRRVIDQLNLINNDDADHNESDNNNNNNKSTTASTNHHHHPAHHHWSSSQDSAVCLSNVDVVDGVGVAGTAATATTTTAPTDQSVPNLSTFIPLNRVYPSFSDHITSSSGLNRHVPLDGEDDDAEDDTNVLQRIHALRQSSRKWSVSMNKVSGNCFCFCLIIRLIYYYYYMIVPLGSEWNIRMASTTHLRFVLFSSVFFIWVHDCPNTLISSSSSSSSPHDLPHVTLALTTHFVPSHLDSTRALAWRWRDVIRLCPRCMPSQSISISSYIFC
ncbi:unnamed protein product [Trichobilharzia regenti]|nr:unnamed protein product [Trichobilharzia regenti]